ncbi:hypothetical protein V2W45_1334926 [Cenococcum geophilum]
MSAPGKSGGRSDSGDTTAALFPTVGITEDYQACLILKGMSLNLTPSELEATAGFLMFIAATMHLPPRGDTAIPVEPAVEKCIPPVGKDDIASGVNDSKPTLRSNISSAELEPSLYGWDLHTHNYGTSTRVENAWAARC